MAQHILIQEEMIFLPITPRIMGQAKLEDTVAETEREALLQAVKCYDSSRKLGAALGLSHTAVLKKLKKYGIKLLAKH
jgi:transcriptional regulator of aroF, aroG, tyrA and aromatic amino acid transport